MVDERRIVPLTDWQVDRMSGEVKRGLVFVTLNKMTVCAPISHAFLRKLALSDCRGVAPPNRRHAIRLRCFRFKGPEVGSSS
jgi:hypothetical protein